MIAVGSTPFRQTISSIKQFDKIHFLTGFGRRGHDNAATVFAFGFGGSYDITERTSLAVIVGQHRQSGTADTDISLTFNWSFGDAPNGERAMVDTQTKA